MGQNLASAGKKELPIQNSIYNKKSLQECKENKDIVKRHRIYC